MRGPPPSVPPPQAAEGDKQVGNLIDLETPSPGAAAQLQNPLVAPASSNDIQARLAGMSKCTTIHWVCVAQFN